MADWGVGAGKFVPKSNGHACHAMPQPFCFLAILLGQENEADGALLLNWTFLVNFFIGESSHWKTLFVAVALKILLYLFLTHSSLLLIRLGSIQKTLGHSRLIDGAGHISDCELRPAS